VYITWERSLIRLELGAETNPNFTVFWLMVEIFCLLIVSIGCFLFSLNQQNGHMVTAVTM